MDYTSIYFVSHGNVDVSLIIDSSEMVSIQFLTLLKNAHIVSILTEVQVTMLICYSI